MNIIKTKNILNPSIKSLNDMNICDLVSFLKREIKIDIASDSKGIIVRN